MTLISTSPPSPSPSSSLNQTPSPSRLPPSPQRPFSISRLSHEFTLFPSYEAMHNLPSAFSLNHQAILPQLQPLPFLQSPQPSNTVIPLSQSSPIPSQIKFRPFSAFLASLSSLYPASKKNFHNPLSSDLSSPHSSPNPLDHSPDWADYHLDPLLSTHSQLVRLVPLSLALLGAQLASSLAVFYALPFLLKLRLSSPATLVLWLAFPLAGLVVPAFVATRADLHTGPYRRRRWIASATLLLVAALLLLAFCQPLGAALTYLIGRDAGDWDPARQLHIHFAAITVGLGALYLLAFALTALTHAARALVLDQLPADQQMRANAWLARLASLADVAVFGAVCTSDAPHGPGQPALLRLLVALVAPAVVACSAATCFSQPERLPPADPARPSHPTLRHQAALLANTLRSLPVPVRRVCMVQLLSALCWLTMLYHSKPLVAHLTLAELSARGVPLTARLVRFAERQGTKAMLAFSLVALLASFALPALCAAGTTRYMVTRRSRRWNVVRRMLMVITPRNVWTASLAVYALLMGSTFWIATGREASVFVGLLGGCWAVAHWVPLGLLMEYTRSIEETAYLVDEPIPAPTSPPASPSTPGPKREPRIAGTVHTAIEPRPLDMRSCASRHGGTFVAVHELASVAAHLVVSVVGSASVTLAQLLTTSPDLMRLNPRLGDTSDGPIVVDKPSLVLWFLRLTGLIAGLACVASWKLVVVPTSELEYWDELKFQIYESGLVESGSESVSGVVGGGGSGNTGNGAGRVIEDD